MIDLRKKGLPNTIVVDGRPFSIYTDFRKWLEFGELLKKENLKWEELYFLFKNIHPDGEFLSELVEFYENKNATPHGGEVSSEKICDFILDGEYIVSDFKRSYNIDLTTVDNLHWHMFQALFRGLTDGSKMSAIMQLRGYIKDSRKQETLMEEAKQQWSFPTEQSASEELRKELEAEFYGCL